MRADSVALAALLLLTPLGARAADLVVFWEKGSYPEEEAAAREIVAAFEQETGKQVEIVFGVPSRSCRPRREAAHRAGQPRPDFVFTVGPETQHYARVGVRGSTGRSHGRHRQLRRSCSIPMLSRASSCSTAGPGRRGLYGLPMGRSTVHIHVWKSLLERAGFTLADIPKRMERLLVLLVRPGPAGGAGGASIATTSGPSAWRCRPLGRYLGNLPAIQGRVRGALRHPDGRLVIDDRGDPTQAHPGIGQLHGHLPQGLHPARIR